MTVQLFDMSTLTAALCDPTTNLIHHHICCCVHAINTLCAIQMVINGDATKDELVAQFVELTTMFNSKMKVQAHYEGL
jgi:hypothetical protein